MGLSKARIVDSVVTALQRGRAVADKNPIKGNVHVALYGPDGELKYEEVGNNLVTDNGDEMVASRMYDDTVDIVSGMRLSTATTAAAKNGAGSYHATGYITGSQEALDATATDATKGAGNGWRTTFVCTWVAGDVTNSNINSVVLTDENPLTDTAGVAADTVARYVFAAAIDKQAGDSLVVTWNIDFLGA